jgi:8-oxo-dGTP diphosphatase
MNPYAKYKKKNINLINIKKDYPLERQVFIGDSIVLTARSDYSWTYISLASEDDLGQVMGLLSPQDTRLMVQDPCVLKYLKDQRAIEWIMSCQKLIYNGPKLSMTYPVYELKETDADYIQTMNDYGDFTDVSYIKTRINKGIGLGIKEQDQLIAWVLTHDDGAIGFIKVLPEYRNKGYAKLLTHEVIARQELEKSLSFVHIEKDNMKSIALAEKVGFETFGEVHWIKLKD